jgi:hypothetical protein
VATSLLMAAIMLVGLVAYQQLPVSALPEVDFPTIQKVTFYGLGRDGAPGTAVWAGAGAEPDDLDQFGRQFGHHAAIRPLSEY